MLLLLHETLKGSRNIQGYSVGTFWYEQSCFIIGILYEITKYPTLSQQKRILMLLIFAVRFL